MRNAVVDQPDLAAALRVGTTEDMTAAGSFFDNNRDGTIRIHAKSEVRSWHGQHGFLDSTKTQFGNFTMRTGDQVKVRQPLLLRM